MRPQAESASADTNWIRGRLAALGPEIAAETGAAGVRCIAVVGSVARGDATESSDVDILVEADDDVTLIDLMDLRKRLQELIGRRVDLLELEALRLDRRYHRGEARLPWHQVTTS
jgi:predicted nucleotidyltransferase